MTRLFLYLIWLIQLVCLATILVCSWLLLNRELFALVAACIVLLTTLYLENNLPAEGDD